MTTLKPMTRRSLLSSLAATLALDPERALWVPGRKLISVPVQRIVHVYTHPKESYMFGQSSIWAYEAPQSDYHPGTLKYACGVIASGVLPTTTMIKFLEEGYCRSKKLRPSSVKFVYV